MPHADRSDRTGSLRYHLQRVIVDMRERAYPPAYFMRALNWPQADEDELLEQSKALLRNPEGQNAAFEYKRRYPNGLTLEDIVVAHGIVLGFDAEDVAIARRTLGS